MKFKQKAVWFLSGVLVTAMAASFASPALAALAAKTIQVSTGLNIYLDDQKFDPKDANGNPVEGFAYNGTTYLPVRAISEALGIPIQWEGSTQSVYVGKHTSDKPAAWLSEMDYFSGTSDNYFYTSTTEKDNLGNTHINCITHNFDRTYIINGQYSKIVGTLYQKYEYRSLTVTNSECGVYIYGDGDLLYFYSPESGTEGMKPVPFSVDLTGVLELKVVFNSNSLDGNSTPVLSLGNVGLYT